MILRGMKASACANVTKLITLKPSFCEVFVVYKSEEQFVLNIGINFDQVMKNLDIPNDHEHEIAFEGDSENSN